MPHVRTCGVLWYALAFVLKQDRTYTDRVSSTNPAAADLCSTQGGILGTHHALWIAFTYFIVVKLTVWSECRRLCKFLEKD
jgi:hypothetical protein